MITHLKRVLEHLKTFEPLKLCSVPDGYEAILIADLARSIACQPGANAAALVFVARDGRRQALIENAFSFVAPDIEILSFPNWDCQPYDRVSPSSAIEARRMTVRARLARSTSSEARPRVVILTANGLFESFNFCVQNSARISNAALTSGSLSMTSYC